MSEAREEIDRLLEAGRPLSDVEERIDQLLIGKEAKAALWLRACLRTRARREQEEGWRYRQLGGEEWLSR